MYTLQVEVEIEAPNALTRPDEFTRTLTRRKGRKADAREIVCLTGPYVDNGLQRLNSLRRTFNVRRAPR